MNLITEYLKEHSDKTGNERIIEKRTLLYNDHRTMLLENVM